MASKALDIQGQGLYTSYSYDYPMVELQESLFRYSSDLDTSDSQKELVVQPLGLGAKNKYCPDCNKLIRDNSIRCASCRMKWINKHDNPMHNIKSKEKMQMGAILRRIEKYKDLEINEETHQILLGSLLGDGCLTIHKWSPRFAESHCMEQKDYLKWKINCFLDNNIPLSENQVFYKKMGKRVNYPMYVCETGSIPQLLYYHSLFYGNGKKEINWRILQQLEPLGVAVWYMDDGNLYNKRNTNEISIATHCFSKDQLRLVKEYFKFRWDIDMSIRPSDNSTSIRKNSIKKFIDLIKPHIHKSMYYKININPIEERYCKECSKKLTGNNNQKFCNKKCKYRCYGGNNNG